MARAGSYSPFEPLTEAAWVSLGSMEGLVAEEPRLIRPKTAAAPLWVGYAGAAGVAAIAYAAHYLPMAPFLVNGRRPIAASILAILLAVAVRNLWRVPASAMVGCKHIVRKIIPVAIVLAGAGLNLVQVGAVGPPVLAVIVVGMAVSTATAILVGRALGLSRRASILIGTGTAVCGTSAIVAAAPLVDAEDEDITLSVGTVSLLGLILMFALPAIAGMLSLDQRLFGIWAGASIHAVPQVVAAGFTYGTDAGSLATLVKLARVAMLAPFLLVLTFVVRGASGRISVFKLIPGFVWGFLALAVVNTLGFMPALTVQPLGWEHSATVKLGPWMVEASNWLLTLAMAAIGLEVNLRLLIRVGGKALIAGVVAMVVLCAASLFLIRALV